MSFWWSAHISSSIAWLNTRIDKASSIDVGITIELIEDIKEIKTRSDGNKCTYISNWEVVWEVQVRVPFCKSIGRESEPGSESPDGREGSVRGGHWLQYTCKSLLGGVFRSSFGCKI